MIVAAGMGALALALTTSGSGGDREVSLATLSAPPQGGEYTYRIENHGEGGGFSVVKVDFASLGNFEWEGRRRL